MNRIDADQEVINTERRFGAAASYVGAVITLDGEQRAALFTREQLFEAIYRAQNNPEDAPKVPAKTWWQRLKAWWDELPYMDP